MGAWGAGIFSNDIACDVRDEYRGLLEEKVPDAEATQRVIDSWKELSDDPDVWLGLAATQWKLGRLEPRVKERALAVIDEGRGLDLWEGSTLKGRKAALAKLRSQLVSPQPPRRTVRRSWRYETDLKLGDVLAVRINEQLAAAIRVTELLNSSPIFEVFPWEHEGLPSIADLDTVAPLVGLALRPQIPSLADFKAGKPMWAWRVGIHNAFRKDPDWHEVGFVLIGSWPAPPEHAESLHSVPGWQYATDSLESFIARARVK